jgi:hypothetical protein
VTLLSLFTVPAVMRRVYCAWPWSDVAGVLYLTLVTGSITAMYGALHCSSQVLVRNKHAIMRSSVQLPNGNVL